MRNVLSIFIKIVLLLVCTTMFSSAYAQFNDSTKVQLKEAKVTGKYINPAHRIIKLASKNKKENSPYNKRNFTSILYQKHICTTELTDSTNLPIIDSLKLLDSLQMVERAMLPDSLLTVDTANTDSLKSEGLTMSHFIDSAHIFMMENVNEYVFRKPDSENYTLKAERTAGIKDPIVAIILSQQFPFSFYKEEVFSFFQQYFISPVAPSAFNKYDFYLRDTIYQDGDSIFVIDFKPYKNVYFNSLKGTLHITSDNYAITKFQFSPNDAKLDRNFVLQQNYKKIDNAWFPSTTNVKLIFNVLFNKDSIDEKRLIVVSEMETFDIKTNVIIKPSQIGFGSTDLDMLPPKEQQQKLDFYRNDSLTIKEQNTYANWDSIANITNMNRWLFVMKTLTNSYIPLGPINLDVFEMFSFNKIEKFRLGLALHTNQRMSKWVSIGGHIAYGFHDKEWKWGGEFEFNIIPKRKFKGNLSYYSDLIESAGVEYLDRDYTLFRGEFYRNWIVQNFDRRDALNYNMQGMIFPWLLASIDVNYNRSQTRFNYAYNTNFNSENPFYTYHDAYLKLGVRIAFKERVFGSGNFYYHQLSRYPVIRMQYTRGFADIINSGFNYNKLDIYISHLQNYRILGYTEFFMYGSIVDRSLPYSLLIAPRAGYAIFGMDGKEQLGAMRPNEFLSDKYFALTIRHNFGRMTANKKFSPRIELIQSFAIGALAHPEHHQGVAFKTMEKGYFETGLVVKDLLVISKTFSFGVGVYCRYGHYWLPKTIDNFAFKLTFRVPFLR